MVPNNQLTTDRQPSPAENLSQTVTRDEGELKQKPDANVPGHELRIEQAETRTEQAETRTEQAKTRTEQAEMRTEQAETRTEQAKTRTEQAEMRTEQAETQREQAIQSAEFSYRRLFEAAKEGILILEADTGRISDVNPFLIEMLGFSHDELVGKPIWELGAFRDIVSNRARFEQLHQQGYILYENLPLETRDGHKIAVEFVSNVYQAGDRKVIQCNVRDITERKRAEMVSMHLAAIVESSEDAIIGKDLNGIITSWNTGAEKIFGQTAGEMVGTSIMQLIPVDRRDEENQILGRIKRGGSVEQFETRRQAKDGRLIDVSVMISPIKDTTGKVVGTSKVARDITARKQAEKAVQVSEERFRTLVEQSLVGIYVIQDGKFVYLNPKMEEIFGVSSEALLAQSVYDFVAPEDRELVRANVEKRVQGLVASLQYDLRILHGNGEVHCVEVHGGRIEYGVMPAIMGTMLDITERKRAEERIRLLNTELEQRVGERTAQLQTANEELEAFSYSVSHDLRAPLRHVLGFVDMLQKDAGPALSATSLRHLTTISQAAKRMGNLIDDLLAFSRIGRAELQKAEVNLDQLVQETLMDFQAETKARNIAWEIRPLPAVRADRALLRLVLVNLLSNAVKFTGTRAEAKIEIGCQGSGFKCEESGARGQDLTPGTSHPALPLTPSAAETVIFIRDNGAGFDPRYAHKLFGVFQRLHSDGEFPGTGIGLANVQRIIQRHGGRTWAEGLVDGGATFYFSIPNNPSRAE